ncbi:MAG: hypothetical protein K0R03_932 [Moraxellaceae bacterium]|nr:hypothetical protein [Moraxellaceae bacterium]
MKALVLATTAVAAIGMTTITAPRMATQAPQAMQLAGNPNTAPNGTNVNSNGASGAPGGSWGAPGQTPNPRPGK